MRVHKLHVSECPLCPRKCVEERSGRGKSQPCKTLSETYGTYEVLTSVTCLRRAYISHGKDRPYQGAALRESEPRGELSPAPYFIQGMPYKLRTLAPRYFVYIGTCTMWVRKCD